MMVEWFHTGAEMPPEGKPVVVMNGPYEQTLVYERGLWWFPDRSMYVYFVPRVWRHIDG